MPSLHNRELLTKSEVFQSQIGAEPKGSKNQRKQAKAVCDDAKVNGFISYGVLTMTGGERRSVMIYFLLRAALILK